MLPALALYAGGGVVFEVRARGRPPSVRSHPHFQKWEALAALCTDGASPREGPAGIAHRPALLQIRNR